MSENQNKSRPLANIRVLDLSKILAGPLCGQMLADFGAEVIKIEPPAGDDNRRWPPMSDTGESCNFMAVNRGKLGITLNLKAEAGRRLLMSLLAQSDVIIHNFLPPVAERLGLSFADLHEKFPRLVVCSISGYGESGPLRDLPGYDAVIAAFAGVMSLTGEPDRLPVRSGVSAIDLTTGILAYGGILTALWARQQDGMGRHVRGSLLETAVSLLNFNAVGWLEAGNLPERAGSGVPHLVPCQIFPCKDGLMYVAAHSDGAWREFTRAIGRLDLLNDPALANNVGRMKQSKALIATLEEEFKKRTYAEWTAILEKTNVPFSPVHRLDEALAHPQLAANHLVVDSPRRDGADRRLLGLPFKVGDTVKPSMQPPPLLGEHTEFVLGSLLDFGPDEIQDLRRSGAI